VEQKHILPILSFDLTRSRITQANHLKLPQAILSLVIMIQIYAWNRFVAS